MCQGRSKGEQVKLCLQIGLALFFAIVVIAQLVTLGTQRTYWVLSFESSATLQNPWGDTVEPFPAFIVCAAANMSATPPTPSPLGAISCSFLEGAGQGSSESETALPAPTLNSVLMTIPGVNQAPEAFNCAIFNVDQQFANGDPVQATFPGDLLTCVEESGADLMVYVYDPTQEGEDGSPATSPDLGWSFLTSNAVWNIGLVRTKFVVDFGTDIITYDVQQAVTAPYYEEEESHTHFTISFLNSGLIDYVMFHQYNFYSFFVTVVCTGAVVAAVWFGGMEGIRRSESGGFQSTRVSRSGGEVFPTPASGGASGNKDGYGAI